MPRHGQRLPGGQAQAVLAHGRGWAPVRPVRTRGEHLGVSLGQRLRAEQLRILLALLVVGVCLKLAADLVIRPDELYSLGAS